MGGKWLTGEELNLWEMFIITFLLELWRLSKEANLALVTHVSGRAGI